MLKDTVIPLSEHEGVSSLDLHAEVEHESVDILNLQKQTNPLQECHVRVIMQKLSEGNVVEESVLFDDTFRSNEQSD